MNVILFEVLCGKCGALTHLPTGYAAINRVLLRSKAVECGIRLFMAGDHIDWTSESAESFRNQATKLPAEALAWFRGLERV